MKNVVRLATVDPHEDSRNALKNMLLGIDTVWLEAECSRYEFFLDVVQQTQPDIALVSLDADPEKGLQLVGEITSELPTCSVLVVSSSQEGSLILRAMRNGAKEFLNLPIKLEDFMSAMDRIRSTGGSGTGEGDVQGCQVISVAGVGGGIGCTALAINMACLLAKNERFSPLVIDLDLTLGDADVWLDIIPEYTIQDVAENISRLDYALLKRSLTRHDCGAFLLPRPVHVEHAAGVSADELRRIVALLKATFSHLIIDTSKSFNSLDMAAMEISDQVLLVSQLDLSSLRNLVRIMQYFEQYEQLVDKTEVIVNRIGLSDNDISLKKALETIGREVFWQIPNDYATMVESRNNGIPLTMQAPKAKLTQSMSDLVRRLSTLDGDEMEEAEAVKQKPRKGLFSFLS
jgi:pilus assembly protein CpaE